MADSVDSSLWYCHLPDILGISLPESEQDLHDAVEVADVPWLLGGAQDAAEDGAAGGGVARLGDHKVHDPLANLFGITQRGW